MHESRMTPEQKTVGLEVSNAKCFHTMYLQRRVYLTLTVLLLL